LPGIYNSVGKISTRNFITTIETLTCHETKTLPVLI
jgi:hypothetical protein